MKTGPLLVRAPSRVGNLGDGYESRSNSPILRIQGVSDGVPHADNAR